MYTTEKPTEKEEKAMEEITYCGQEYDFYAYMDEYDQPTIRFRFYTKALSNYELEILGRLGEISTIASQQINKKNVIAVFLVVSEAVCFEYSESQLNGDPLEEY